MRLASGQPNIEALIMGSRWSGNDGEKTHGELRMLVNMIRTMVCCEGDDLLHATLLMVRGLTNLLWASNHRWVVSLVENRALLSVGNPL